MAAAVPVVPDAEATPTTPQSAKPGYALSKEDAAKYISDPRFHRTFTLPAEASYSLGLTQPLQISYADFGHNPHDASASSSPSPPSTAQHKVLLFFGPPVSTPLFSMPRASLATRHAIRIIHAARPGIGSHSTAVPADKLLQICRDALPHLLRHLGIRHVTLAAHSAGTLFSLDFALHYPEFLDPGNPYIAIAWPWVHPVHTGVTSMTIAAKYLPSGLVAHTDKVATLINGRLAPVLGVSAVISGSLGRLLPLGRSEEEEEVVRGREGEDVAFQDAIGPYIVRHIFQRGGNVVGLGGETQVLLRNGACEKEGWSDWGDFDGLVPRLVEAVGRVTERRLRVDVWFAENDQMIGDAGSRGVRWFEGCWEGVDGVEFRREVVERATHDDVWELRWDLLERVFGRINEGV